MKASTKTWLKYAGAALGGGLLAFMFRSRLDNVRVIRALPRF